MDAAEDARHEAIAREAAALCARFPLDYWRERDRTETYPDEFVAACVAAGWFGAIVPEAYGGRGWGVTEAGVLLRAVCESGAGTSGASPLHLAIFPPYPLVRHGSAALKARSLPRLATGELRMAFGVTEAEAGTDTSRIATRAERRGDRWVLNGEKAWLSNARHAQKALLLARTSPRDPARPLDGLTLFFADLDPRSCALEVIDKLGRNAVDSNRLTITDLEVAAEDVVGEVGRGFSHLLAGLNAERIVIALEAVGIGRAALGLATAYARERVVFGRPIGQNQAVAHPLARAWADLAAAELLALKAARLFDEDRPCGAEANAAKVLAAEAGCATCDAAVQALGGRGYRKDYHVERLWREVRLYKIAPISQEMALNYLAEHVLGLPKSY
ncbi:MAG TPA: acyl-CoA dehydrogenase family protein [Thermomicrobiales bacterium]|nr:acyl-CoA dehydrogenase family protein [Thermomicrobiales bacterium]